MHKAKMIASDANLGAGFDTNNMGGNPGTGPNPGQSNPGSSDDNVTDVAYEEVK